MKNDNIPSVFVTNNFHILNIYAKIIESKTNKVFVHCFVNLIEEIDKKSTILVNDEIKKKMLTFPIQSVQPEDMAPFWYLCTPIVTPPAYDPLTPALLLE